MIVETLVEGFRELVLCASGADQTFFRPLQLDSTNDEWS